MRAALVTAFDRPPRAAEVPEPEPAGPDDVVMDVLAAGLHPRVRSQAAGSHYTSSDELPLVPGIDGVGRTPDGRRHYFVLPDTRFGSMAERVVVDRRRSVELPADVDPVRIAAVMNPAMSSWVALRRRIAFSEGGQVLVLGATGSAGRLAVQVAKRLGASTVIAAGRDADRLATLPALGADVTVRLTGDAGEWAAELGATAARADVVLDYVWGEPTRDALLAVVPRRADDRQPLTWVQIGSVAGADCAVPSAALRATRLQIVGSGQGSVPTAEIVAELRELARAVTDGGLAVDARAMPLELVSEAWEAPPGERIVITPGRR